MATIRDIVFDCAHPAALARFWAAALDGYSLAPYDDDELARLRSIGVLEPEDDPAVLVSGPAEAPRLWFQQVPEAKQSKNRVHLDLSADDYEREIERLLELGATLAATQASERWTVLHDPEGNEFCLMH